MICCQKCGAYERIWRNRPESLRAQLVMGRAQIQEQRIAGLRREVTDIQFQLRVARLSRIAGPTSTRDWTSWSVRSRGEVLPLRCVYDAIAKAEAVLPGHAAPEGDIDPRWQAIIAVGEFIETEQDAVWSFILQWSGHPDEDLRTAIAAYPGWPAAPFHLGREL